MARTGLVRGVVGFVIVLACGWTAAALEDAVATAPTRIVLERDARFATPGGDTAGVGAGAWRVEAIGDAALRLVPDDGAAMEVAAREAPHTETLAGPLAVAVAGDAGAQHVLLLFPDGTGLEAIGTVGDVSPRGDAPVAAPLPADAVKRGVADRGAIPPVARADALARSGRAFFAQSTEWGHWRAIRSFESALVVDPRFAPAEAGLADAYALLYLHAKPTPEYLADAKKHAARAVALAPTSSQARASQGYVLSIGNDLAGARRELELALRYDPKNALARQWYAGVLMSSRQVDASLREIARAAADDPGSAICQGIASRLHQVVRRYDDAIRYGVRAQQRNPNLPGFLRMSLAYSYWAKQRTNDAVEALLLEPTIPAAQKPALRALGQSQGVRALVEQLFAAQVAKSGRPCTDVPSIAGTLLAFLGRTSEALDCLSLSQKEGVPPAFLALDPILDPVRKDPRFARLAAER